LHNVTHSRECFYISFWMRREVYASAPLAAGQGSLHFTLAPLAARPIGALFVVGLPLHQRPWRPFRAVNVNLSDMCVILSAKISTHEVRSLNLRHICCPYIAPWAEQYASVTSLDVPGHRIIILNKKKPLIYPFSSLFSTYFGCGQKHSTQASIAVSGMSFCLGAKFLVPDWGIKSTMANSCRTGRQPM
jgi:hypothetical protein